MLPNPRHPRPAPARCQANKTRRASAATCALACLTLTHTAAAPGPDARRILEEVRLGQAERTLTLDARLRVDNRTLPLTISARGSSVEYRFPDSGLALQLTLGQDRSTLRQIAPGTPHTLDSREQSAEIADTGVTREDLALHFLYWPDPKIEGEENLRTRNCWIIRLTAPDRTQRYSVVFAWIDQGSRAIMRMIGHDWDGRKIRRFEVISGQRISGQWMLKQMRVETFEPATGKVARRAYLEILGERS